MCVCVCVCAYMRACVYRACGGKGNGMETNLLTFFSWCRIKQIVSEVVIAAVQKEVGAAVQEQMARMSPEVRQEEERRKKQVRARE